MLSLILFNYIYIYNINKWQYYTFFEGAKCVQECNCDFLFFLTQKLVLVKFNTEIKEIQRKKSRKLQ